MGLRPLPLCAALLLLACSSSPQAPSAATSPGDPVAVVVPDAMLGGLSVSTGDLVPAFNPALAEYTLTANGSIFPIDVTAAAGSALSLAINGQPATTGTALTLQLQPRQDLVVDVVAGNGARSTYIVHYAPPELPSWSVATIDASRAGAEAVLLTPADKWLLLVDRQGSPLYYRSFAPTTVTDFKQQLIGGKTYYAYVSSTGNDATGAYDGQAHVLDDRMREITPMKLVPNRDHGDLSADVHDFLVLGDEHYLLMSYVPEVMDLATMNPAWSNAATVIAGLVQEIDHGTVVFEWQTTDLASLFADSVDGNAFADVGVSDYVHMNSFQIDPFDGNVLVSLRHSNSVLKLDHATGAVLWTLGGKSDQFGVTAEQFFSHQHHVRRQDDGTYMMFDNGNGAHATRVLRFGLDEAQKKVTSFEVVYARPDGQPDTSFMGSAFRLGDARYLVGWGGHADTTTLGPAVTEVVGGAPVWSLTFDAASTISYRAAPVVGP